MTGQGFVSLGRTTHGEYMMGQSVKFIKMRRVNLSRNKWFMMFACPETCVRHTRSLKRFR